MSHLPPNNRKVLSVIIPAYNEQETIVLIIEKINKTLLVENISKEIIVINDGSEDGTLQEVEQFKCNYPAEKIVLINMAKNSGKGACVRKGLNAATGDYIIIQDADLEYDPSDFNTLLKPVIKGHADVVYGSRFMGKDPHRIMLFWHYVGNVMLTFISNMLTNLNLTDMETGYKLFRSEIINQLTLKENRFGFEPEVTAKLSQIPNIRIYEVGISYYGRTYKEGKKISWKDGILAIFYILKYNLFTRRNNTSKA